MMNWSIFQNRRLYLNIIINSFICPDTIGHSRIIGCFGHRNGLFICFSLLCYFGGRLDVDFCGRHFMTAGIGGTFHMYISGSCIRINFHSRFIRSDSGRILYIFNRKQWIIGEIVFIFRCQCLISWFCQEGINRFIIC